MCNSFRPAGDSSITVATQPAKQQSRAKANWPECLQDLLISIAEEIMSYEDLTAFRGVCAAWKFAASNISRPSRLPSLLLAENVEEEGDLRKLFLLSKDDVDDNRFYKVMLPEARKRRCLSSHGWLLTVETIEGHPHLLHPYSRHQLLLPRIDTLPDFKPICNDHLHYIVKVVLSSSDPSSQDFLVMIIWGGKGDIGFCRPGDASWTVPDIWDSSVQDITFYNGFLYAVDSLSAILVIDVRGKNFCRLQIISTLPRELRLFLAADQICYISRSTLKDNKLLVVNRQWEYLNNDGSPHYKTKRFQVFEFSFDNQGGKWERIDNLGGNRALFIGYNSSFVFEIETEAELCIKPDCIYYTDDVAMNYLFLPNGGGSDMGIYHMRDGSFETVFDLWESLSFLTPPTWVFDEPCF